MSMKILKNHKLRVEYYQMLAQIFFQEKIFMFWKAEKGSRNAGGLNRLAAGQLVTLKQETDSYFLFPQTTRGQDSSGDGQWTI